MRKRQRSSRLKKKYIIFDFDGTIADTNELIIDAWQHIFTHYRGEKEEESKLYHTFGETLEYSIKNMIPEADTEEAISMYREYQRTNNHRKHLFPEIRELMEYLKDRSYVQAVVTSRTAKTTEAYMKDLGIEDYFDLVITCDDVKAHKPDPLPLLIALEKLGAEREEAIMIGDTRFDIGCANNAGVDSALAGWSKAFSEDDLLKYTPTHRLENPMDLIKII